MPACTNYGEHRNAFYPWAPAPYPAEYRLVFRRVCCAEPTAQRRLISVCAGINACHCCNDSDGPTPTTHEKASLQSTNWSHAAKPHATVYCLPVEEVRVRGRVRRRDPGLLRLLQDFSNVSLCVASSASCCVSEFRAVTYGRLRHSRRSAATMQHLVSRGSFA